MDELGAIWLIPQSEDDLKQKILLTTFELENVKIEMKKMKHESEINQKQLLAQIQLAYEERDEAKLQLQQLLESFLLPSSTPQDQTDQLQTLEENNNHCCHQIPIPTTKPHSGITDLSNDDIDSFFDTVSSTEKSFKNVEDLDDDEFNSSMISPIMLGAGQPMVDLMNRATIVIEQLVNGKVLPHQGRLLQEVMKAGPTLKEMMLAGPLPQWKNPPPVQPFRFLPNNGMLINNNVCADKQRVLLQPRLSTFMMCPSPRMDGEMIDATTCLSDERMMMGVGNNKVLATGKRPRLL
ncbi:unnamed protein product [Rhodiola kirilowii]